MEARDRETRMFTVHTDDVGRRLDRVLRKLAKAASLDRIYTALRKGEVTVDGSAREPSYRLGAGQQIRLAGPLVTAVSSSARTGPAPARVGEPLVVESLVLYRCRHFIVFDKPRGLPVHGEVSLAVRAQGLLSASTEPSLSFRPGPVHRLDRDTTGIVLFALTLTGAQTLSALLRDRACEKIYLALLTGTLDGPVDWSDTITRDRDVGRSVRDAEGDLAITRVQPLATTDTHTLARVRIETGRTHQIRAQASLHGHPLAGDVRYGGTRDPVGYVLHSARFSLPEDTGLAAERVFQSPLPPSSREIVDRVLGRVLTSSALASFHAGFEPRIRS